VIDLRMIVWAVMTWNCVKKASRTRSNTLRLVVGKYQPFNYCTGPATETQDCGAIHTIGGTKIASKVPTCKLVAPRISAF